MRTMFATAPLLVLVSAAYADNYTYTPNSWGGGTFNGPSGTTTYTPNSWGGGTLYGR